MLGIRFLLLIFCTSVLFAGTAGKVGKSTATKHSQVMPIPIVQTRSLSSFTSIAVDGAMNVSLHTGSPTPKIIVRGDSRDVEKVLTTVKNKTLVVRLNIQPKFGAVTVEIYGGTLHSFRYRGAGVIVGKEIHSRLLDLSIRNSETTKLTGSINLHKLAINGGVVEISGIKSPFLKLIIKGKPHVKLNGIVRLAALDMNGGLLELYWVTNDLISIRAASNSVIVLAGIAKRLELELHGFAQFRGRYLRVLNTFVKTFDRSVAEINSLDKQHTLASGGSDILFYNIPIFKSDFMACNGAVLDMRDWNLPFLQEYNRYNKDAAIGDWP